MVTYDPSQPGNRGTNLENYGVAPDVWVENSPQDELAGFDRLAREMAREARSPVVLIADDLADTRQLIAQELEEIGASVLLAPSGSEATIPVSAITRVSIKPPQRRVSTTDKPRMPPCNSSRVDPTGRSG